MHGGKCSESLLSNLKIIKGHGGIYADDVFVVPDGVKIITMVPHGQTIPKCNIEFEILKIFANDKQNDFFDFDQTSHTERESKFENFMRERSNINCTIDKHFEKMPIHNHIISFKDNFTGIFCTNKRYETCMPDIYGKNIYKYFTRKGFEYVNATIENLKLLHKYIVFILDNNIRYNIQDFNIVNDNQDNKINRLRIIQNFIINMNSRFTLITNGLSNEKYNNKKYTFSLEKTENVSRYAVLIDNEKKSIAIHGKNLIIYDTMQQQSINIDQIMEFNVIDFLNQFAISVPIELIDDDKLYVENTYNKDVNGTFTNCDLEYIYVNVMKCRVKQINLYDLIQLEGIGIYILYICREEL